MLFDCRSYAAANANRFRGGGVENCPRYGARSAEFGGLRNVHYVRRVVLALRIVVADEAATRERWGYPAPFSGATA